jgi:hypothetical protein
MEKHNLLIEHPKRILPPFLDSLMFLGVLFTMAITLFVCCDAKNQARNIYFVSKAKHESPWLTAFAYLSQPNLVEKKIFESKKSKKATP